MRITLLDGPPRATEANPQAYVLYLQARQINYMQREDENSKAAALLKRALEISPDYIDAMVLQTSFLDEPEAEELEERILTLDPDNPGIKSWMATIRWQDRDYTGAARLLEEAADTDPYNPDVLFASARLASAIGKTGLAVRLGEYIAVRDPLFFWAQLNLAQHYFKDGRIEDALRQFETALSINENAGAVRWKYGLALLMAGNPENALAEFEREEGSSYRLHGLALAYHDLGKDEESAAALRELTELERKLAESRKGHSGWPYGLARAHAWIGNVDEAIRYLEATAEYTPGHLGDIANNPLFQRIQDDPRWLAFLSSVGVAPEQLAAIKFNVEPPD